MSSDNSNSMDDGVSPDEMITVDVPGQMKKAFSESFSDQFGFDAKTLVKNESVQPLDPHNVISGLLQASREHPDLYSPSLDLFVFGPNGSHAERMNADRQSLLETIDRAPVGSYVGIGLMKRKSSVNEYSFFRLTGDRKLQPLRTTQIVHEQQLVE